MKRRIYFLLFFLISSQVLWGRVPCSTRYCGLCSCAQLAGWWGDLDYLLIWRKSRFYPPLAENLLGEIVFGDRTYNKSPKSGIKGDGGVWITPCYGVGAGAWGVFNEKIRFKGDNLFLTDFPSFFGPIDIRARNKIWGADVYGRVHLLDLCCFYLDFLGGFLFSNVRDDLELRTSGTFITTNRFLCKNKFYSVLLGAIAEFRSCNWGIYAVGKLGLGNMRRRVHIFGDGPLITSDNVGVHKKIGFEAVPEVHVEIQLKLCCNIWASVGYIFFYWPHVALAGDQIDILAPIFEIKERSFYAQGFTAGIYTFF